MLEKGTRAGDRHIPAERLPLGKAIMALHTIRSEGRFCELHKDDPLFRGSLDPDSGQAVFDPSLLSQNPMRLPQFRTKQDESRGEKLPPQEQ